MYKLCTRPTQFSPGKTQETLCDISKRYEINKLLYTSTHHLLEIIVTNKSLQETEQWKYRTTKEFEKYTCINIDILSSKSKDYKSINDYIVNIINCNDKNDLPNILIICFHEKRVCDDIIRLINTLQRCNFTNIGISGILFHISMDEPDANIGVTKKFIQNIHNNNSIIGILFITATPIPKFWNMLKSENIDKLLNMNNEISNFDEDFNNYRNFEQHEYIKHENTTNNPLDYIKDLYDNNIINDNQKNIIFAPAHLYTEKDGVGSHDELVNYFKFKNYCVLLMNGQFKGFIYPDNITITLYDYKQKYNIEGELRDILRHWKKNNQNTSLAITGNWIIERGVTFNTDGFNFTHMILSNYHSKNIGKLIQMAGRSTGNIKYVHKMKFISTSKIYNDICEFNKNLKAICSFNPDYFIKSNFNNNTSNIPVKVKFADINILSKLIELKKNNKNYKKKFHTILINSIETKKTILYDKNNINNFNIYNRKLNQVRMYKLGDNIDSRRFEQFNNAFNNFDTVSQSCKDNEYNIDILENVYIKNNGYIQNIDIAWITFKN